MKKLAMVVTLSILSFISFGQKVKEKNVPQVIKTALHQKYSNAKEIKWDKEENNYEASFDINGVDNSVLFSQDGKIVETEVEIQINQLPKNALDYLNVNFKNARIKEAAKIINLKGKIIFEAEIKTYDILFDEKGGFISKNKV
ncbi:PepSY-like domain-containing protein [Flavobacterium sp. ZT3R25]|uniref:PepSY-like domain-containing protein n=1 Tax=Flavobacterium galactosi TaxID=3398735 RepID=UPI003A89217D